MKGRLKQQAHANCTRHIARSVIMSNWSTHVEIKSGPVLGEHWIVHSCWLIDKNNLYTRLLTLTGSDMFLF